MIIYASEMPSQMELASLVYLKSVEVHKVPCWDVGLLRGDTVAALQKTPGASNP